MRHNALTRILIVAGLFALFGCNKQGAAPTATTPAAPSPGASGDNSAATDATTASSPKAPESFFAPKPIVVETGTPIVVTVDQSVSSKTSNPGDHFDASLAAPIRVGDQEVIPAGARVVGTVTDAKSAGRFKGNASITVTLEAVKHKGQTYPIRTTSVTEAGKGRGKRTAVGAGGGAAVGAIIGAIAGGGKGAAIGAGAGGGAGTAGAALTGNRDVTISAETKLRFRLKAPLEIKGA